jgi:release factor glutamine methyltransferase
MVTPEVLIPRLETEELIDAAREVIPQLSAQKGRGLRVADMGTGSGCIAITLTLELPQFISKIIATDISMPALAVARKNAANYDVHTIEFTRRNMLAGLPDTHIDLVVSNPPYVPSRELTSPPTLLTQGLAFEPKLALDGGTRGTRFTDVLRSLRRPLIMEVTGGEIETFI